MSANTRYRVYMTPLVSAYVYGSEIEISDYVENVAGTITSSIDSTDFSVGVYTFNDVQITCDNSDGKLSDSSDSRTLFPYSRDKAKIRIVFDNGDNVPPTTYRGLINDEATVVQSDSDELVFTILGPDSILKNTNISAGTITNGMTVIQALVAILNTADVRSTLGVYLQNLNPQNNITIDDGTKFDNLNKRDAIALLLGASNSVMIIDSSATVIVRDRSPNWLNPILYLYGKGDSLGRENIRSISNYNTGLQRTFNSVLVTGGQPTATVDDISSVQQVVTKKALVGSASSSTSQAIYGIRQKAFQFDWLTTQATLDSVAQGYINEFAFPKLELTVIVSTADAATVQVLDEVSVNYPLFVRPSGKFLPIIGITKIGDTDSPLPFVKGAISIDGSLGFKVIEKTEDITTYETTLKLRQIGVGQTDGGLIVPTSTRTITASDTILTTDDFILVDATSGAIDLKCPAPSATPQKMYTVMRIDSTTNLVRLVPNGSEALYSNDKANSGSAVELRTQYDGCQIQTNRTNWYCYLRSAQPQDNIPNRPFTLTNNQSAAADVTGLLFDKANFRSAIATVDVRRKTDTAASEVRAIHVLRGIYNAQADTWSLQEQVFAADGVDDGVTFSIVAGTGQVQYQTTNITGANGIHNAYFNTGRFNA